MKTPLKTILFSALATITIFLAITYTSCNRDRCKTIVCANGGVCNEGQCICPSGYEGSNCETISRDKFVANWQVFEKGSTTNASQYGATITRADNISYVVITNFYNYFTSSVNAYVIGDTLYIPNQQLQGKVIFGKGYIYSNATYGQFANMSLVYEVIDTATNTPDDFGFYLPDGSAPSQWTKTN